MTPVQPQETKEERPPLGTTVPDGRFVELPGRGTTYIRELAGPAGAPTVFLLHGLSATGALNWFPAFGALSRHFRVVAIDHRGHGRGLRPKGRFRLADCADDAAAAADVLGLDSFIAVGYSMGGPIAQLIWHRHRSRVSGMVLCATSRNFRGRPRERLQFAGLAMMNAGLRLAPHGPIGLAMERLMTLRNDDPAARRWALAELQRSDVRLVLEAAQAIGNFSSHGWIGRVDVPTSVVVTTRDQLVPARRQIKLATSIPSAVIFPVEGDHLVCFRDPSGTFVPVLVEACQLVATRSERWAGGKVPRR